MRSAVLLLSSFMLSACGTTQFMVQRRAPAEVDIPAGRALAVARIEGDGGEALAAELTAALFQTKHFKVLERRNINAALGELRFSAAGNVSDETAMSFGEMTGAATLVIGQVLNAGYREKVEESQEKCSRNGRQVDCTRYTRIAEADLQVELKVVETESGSVLAARLLPASERREASNYDTVPPRFAQREPMLSLCRSRVVRAFVEAVAPHDVAVMVVLRTNGDIKEMEVGNNYARLGKWSEAADQYQLALRAAQAKGPEEQAAAQYNLGIALGFSGEFDEGLAAVELAYALDPQDLYLRQRDALRKLKEDAARVARQQPGAAP